MNESERIAKVMSKVSEQDMHEMKREHVRNYVRTRNFVRMAVKHRLIDANDARMLRASVKEQRYAWRLLWIELRALWAESKGRK